MNTNTQIDRTTMQQDDDNRLMNDVQAMLNGDTDHTQHGAIAEYSGLPPARKRVRLSVSDKEEKVDIPTNSNNSNSNSNNSVTSIAQSTSNPQPRGQRKPPSFASTASNLRPNIQQSMSANDMTFSDLLAKYQSAERDLATLRAAANDEETKLDAPAPVVDIFTISIKEILDSRGKRWTEHEVDRLHSALNTAMYKEGRKPTGTGFWRYIKDLTRTTRSEDSIRVKFNSLSSAAGKDEYKHSELSAIANDMTSIKASTSVNDSTSALLKCTERMMKAKQKAKQIKDEHAKEKAERNKKIDLLLEKCLADQTEKQPASQPVTSEAVLANALLSLKDPLVLLQMAMKSNPALGSLQNLYALQHATLPPAIQPSPAPPAAQPYYAQSVLPSIHAMPAQYQQPTINYNLPAVQVPAPANLPPFPFDLTSLPHINHNK